MTKLLYGIAMLPFVAGVALAGPMAPASQQVASVAPMQLTGDQMDKVTAGWSLHEIDLSNTSFVEVSVYSQPLLACSTCYLRLTTSSISVQSQMGPGLPPP